MDKEATQQTKGAVVPPADELWRQAVSKLDLKLTATASGGPYIINAKVEKQVLDEFTMFAHPNTRRELGKLSKALDKDSLKVRFANSAKGLMATAITVDLSPKMLQEENVDSQLHPWKDMKVKFRKGEGGWNEVELNGGNDAHAWRTLVQHAKGKLEFEDEKAIFDALANAFASVEEDGKAIGAVLVKRVEEMTGMLPPQLVFGAFQKE